MDKKLVERVIYYKTNPTNPFTWQDLKGLDLQDDDVICISHERYEEDSDPFRSNEHYFLQVTRMELETDMEYEQRLIREEKQRKYLQERRFETYKKLREEFKDRLE